jgi:hypothetical protein
VCRRISIDIEWDDEHPTDAEPAFYFDKDGEPRISPEFENKLILLVEDNCVASVTLTVGLIPRGG